MGDKLRDLFSRANIALHLFCFKYNFVLLHLAL